MKSQGTTFPELFILKPVGRWLFCVTFFAFAMLMSLIFNWHPLFILGAIVLSLLAYFLSYYPKPTLFSLILIRMLLDYFSENYNIALNNSLSLSFSQVLGILIFIAGILYIIKNASNFKHLPLKIPILSYTIFSIVTIFYSISPFDSLREIIRLFDLAFLFFLSYTEFKKINDFSKLLNLIFVSSLISALVALYQYAFHIGYIDADFSFPRIYGTFSHPNSFSLFLVSIIALLFIRYVINISQQKRLLTVGLIGLYSFLIILTYTRVAWVAILAFIFIIGIFRFRKLLLASILLAITIYAISFNVQQRVQDAVYTSPDSSLTWRMNLWKDAIDRTYSNNRQYLGFGSNTFEIVLEETRGNQLGSTAAHNDFIRAFLEGGYVGLIIFVFYIFYIAAYLFWRYWNSGNSAQKTVFLIMFALIISISLASLTDNVMRNTPLQWIFWIALGAILGTFAKSSRPSKI